MKTLIIQENGRHDKNRNFRECFSLKRAFEFNGYESLVWGLGHENFDKRPDFNSYDIIINLENYDLLNWVPNLSAYNKPIKLLWSVDAHCRGEEVFEKTFEEGKYSCLLHSTKDFVKKKHHIWFPNSYDDDIIHKKEINKKHKIGFCGNIVNRQLILNELQQKFDLKLDVFVIGEDMVEAINSYECHFNLNISNDLNYRSFETIGCGTLLLTNFNHSYLELGFSNEKNCLIYKDKKELFDYIINLDYFTKNPETTKKTLELAKRHTYKKRIESLLKQI